MLRSTPRPRRPGAQARPRAQARARSRAAAATAAETAVTHQEGNPRPRQRSARHKAAPPPCESRGPGAFSPDPGASSPGRGASCRASGPRRGDLPVPPQESFRARARRFYASLLGGRAGPANPPAQMPSLGSQGGSSRRVLRLGTDEDFAGPRTSAARRGSGTARSSAARSSATARSSSAARSSYTVGRDTVFMGGPSLECPTVVDV